MADDTAPLASLSLTHVYYDPSDPVSYLCAWLALVPQALCIVYVTLIWSSREAEVALMFAGQLGCEAVNFALKRLIKEERPRRIHGKGYGMPSSHAQFVAFWALSLALFLLVRHKPRGYGGDSGGKEGKPSSRGGTGAVVVAPASAAAAAVGNGSWQEAQLRHLQSLYALHSYPHRPWSLPERSALSVLGLSLAALVAWSRVYLGYHTPRQVAVGSAAGLASAFAWFALTAAARRVGLLDWAIDLPAARWFRFRDLVVAEDIAQAGWEKWVEERRARVEAGRGRGRAADDKNE